MTYHVSSSLCVLEPISSTHLLTVSFEPDNSPHATVWSVIECNTGIICACLPMMRLPLSFICPNLFTTYESSRGQSNYYSRSGVSSYYRRSRASRGRSADPNLARFTFPWTSGKHDDSTVLTSVSNDKPPTPRSDSEENMIGLEPVSSQAIVKRTDVSVSESRYM